jgi:anthranilate phosphoribosyltransferase
VVEVREAGTQSYSVHPEEVGLECADVDSVGGGTPERNAEIVKRLFEGERGPRRSFAVMNAAAALMVAQKASNLEEGARLAEETIDSGAALDSLQRFVKRTNELAPEG